jgi:pyruvate dehydrogenase E2 component (dihydrolipoamide acetyltransferase)
VKIPDLGSDEGADLVEILVPVGGEVEEGDSLVLLESDKASMEVPAPASGTVLEWLVETGATLTEGVVIARLTLAAPAQAAAPAPESDVESSVSEPSGKADQSPPATESSSHAAETPRSVALSEPTSAQRSVSATNAASDSGAVYAGPAVRKLAREFGVSLSKVSGTGARGRILKEDLQQYVAQTLAAGGTAAGAGIPEIPDQDYARFGAIEKTSRSRIDKVTAANMVRSWLNVPHVTQFDDADISGMERFRAELKGEAAERGVKLTPLPFILKACAVALRDHPKLKSSLADGGETLVMKHYCHIGMAVDTPAGLVVPVIRDVDKKSIWELAAEVAEVAVKAKDRQLKPDDMQGGVFTVSSLGALGGRGFTPIINAPEVAILGVGRASVQPVWDGEVFRPHTLLPLALSYDHRVVNGGDGGRFMTDLTALLADVKRMVM